MDVAFTKMSGAGNDFIVVDRTAAPPGEPDWLGAIPSLCDRRRGVGADGLILLEPAGDADFVMRYFNADGSSGSLCGNGGRCAASLVMERLRGDAVTFRSNGRRYRAERTPAGVRLAMEDAGPARMAVPVDLGDATLTGHVIDTGSPHFVLSWENGPPDARTVADLGARIRSHPAFAPGGTNVDFMTPLGPDRIALRTYERGVEGETWACGTGAVAAAMIRSVLEGGEGERRFEVIPLSGEPLRVEFTRKQTTFTGVTLDGAVRVTFTGSFSTGPLDESGRSHAQK